MKVIVIGKTGATLTLNKIGVPIRGKEKAILNIDSTEKQNELNGLINAGFLDIVSQDTAINEQNTDIPEIVIEEQETIVDGAPEELLEETEEIAELPEINVEEPIQLTHPDPIKKDAPVVQTERRGRPKGSKNKEKKSNKTTKTNKIKKILNDEDIAAKPVKVSEQKMVKQAEDLTQKMGSRVVIGTGDGVKEGKMLSSFASNIENSERTRESIEALKRIEKEENEDIILPDIKIDESKLDESEQMGRKATIITEQVEKSVDMVNNSVLGKDKKQRDPFIDREDKKNIKDVPLIEVIDKPEDEAEDDEFGSAFIKI